VMGVAASRSDFLPAIPIGLLLMIIAALYKIVATSLNEQDFPSRVLFSTFFT
jgi:hypothetical protein